MSVTKLDYVALNACSKALVCALKHRDSHTQLHSQRVIDLSECLGKACGLYDMDIGILKMAACFHDIGKIGIPDEILLKAGKLDSEEWDVMKTHSENGEDIVRGLEMEGCNIISLAVRHHHEHYNGCGYPDQISGDEIPIFSRIISVADSFDAMAETRPYHKARAHQQVMDIMSVENGIKFDPYVFNKLQSIVKESQYITK